MSVSFSVSDLTLRPFINTIQCAAKLGDGVFFVAHKTYVEVSTLSSASSCHLLAVVPADTLGGYRFTPCAGEDGDEGNEVFFYLLSRSLQATVLHQATNTLASMTVSFSLSPQEGDEITDAVKWECACVGGVLKTFHLRTATGVPKRVCTDGVDYPFVVRGNPHVFGQLLASLPPSAKECVFFPLSNRLELRHGERVTTKASERHGDTPTAAGAAVVCAYPPNFDLFECAPDSEQQTGGSALPGKMIELKPIKVASMLCKYLGLPLEMCSGYERAPVVVRSTYTQSNVQDRGHQSDSYVPISFVMHVAGVDVSYTDTADDAGRRDSAAVTARNTAHPQQPEYRDNVEPPSASHDTTLVIGTISDKDGVVGTPCSAPGGTAGTNINNTVGESPQSRWSRVQPSSEGVNSLNAPLSPGVSAQAPSQATHVDASFVSGSANTSEPIAATASKTDRFPHESNPASTPMDSFPVASEAQNSTHRTSRGSVVPDSQAHSRRQSMTALFPLDFDAFTKASAEEAKEEVDEELQRFLDSCTAMLMGEAGREHSPQV